MGAAFNKKLTHPLAGKALGLRGKFTSKLILPVGRIQFCAIMGLRALLARGHSQILLHFLSCGSPLSSSQQWHNVFMPQISDLSSGSNQRKFHTFKGSGTSLVVQWLRIRLPMQETWIQSLVRGKFYMPQSNYAYGAQLLSPCSRACKLKLLSSALQSVLHKRSHCNEKPTECNKE